MAALVPSCIPDLLSLFTFVLGTHTSLEFCCLHLYQQLERPNDAEPRSRGPAENHGKPEDFEDSGPALSSPRRKIVENLKISRARGRKIVENLKISRAGGLL